VLDPLFARALVLEAGDQRFALVILDLGRVPAPSWIDQLRASVKQSSGIGYVLVAATAQATPPRASNCARPTAW